jgi:hypothetical protein
LEEDTAVWAVESEPENSIAEQAKASGIEITMAGDAVKPRRIFEAVHEGAQAAKKLLFG